MIKRLEYLVGAYGPAIARHILREPIWYGDRDASTKTLYLTFDDGHTPHLTPVILDILGDLRVPASFFLLGRQVDRHPDLAIEIERRKHVIGVHGYAHLDAWKHPSAMVNQDLLRSVEAVRSRIRAPLRYYRPPYGRFTRGSLRLARQLSLRLVMWGIMPGDYIADTSADVVAARVMRRLRPGSIIVLHDSANENVRRHTAPALRRVVEEALNDGWSFKALPR